VRELRVWAAKDGSTLHVPRKLEAETVKGEEWAPIIGQSVQAGDDPALTVIRLPGTPLTKLRIVQPPHGGSKDRPDLIWISEIEVVTE
jgi:hypothetical protein